MEVVNQFNNLYGILPISVDRPSTSWCRSNDIHLFRITFSSGGDTVKVSKMSPPPTHYTGKTQEGQSNAVYLLPARLGNQCVCPRFYASTARIRLASHLLETPLKD